MAKVIISFVLGIVLTFILLIVCFSGTESDGGAMTQERFENAVQEEQIEEEIIEEQILTEDVIEETILTEDLIEEELIEEVLYPVVIDEERKQNNSKDHVTTWDNTDVRLFDDF